MIFIAGPRQSGKTFLTNIIAEEFNNSYYFNWDIIDEKRKLIENPSFYENINLKDDSIPLVIFDELHKFPDWKNYLKNVFDRDKENYKFIVSGSGRLDVFQKGGDSLAGRYLLFHLWPFTLAELAGLNLSLRQFINNPLKIYPEKEICTQIWEDLKRYSGFPDPYLQKNPHFYKIWSTTYKKQLLREDIRDMAALRNSENVEILYSLLPSKIGSPLSMANLSRDIKVSFDTIKKWLDVFEKFFMIFRLSTWTAKIPRAITKEKKLYLFDYASIDSKGAKFENMVALELYRAVSNWNDTGLGDFSLHFIRNREKQEVDFLLAEKNKPFLLIETRLSDATPGKSLLKFQNILNTDAILLVDTPGICRKKSNRQNKLLIISADHWLPCLP